MAKLISWAKLALLPRGTHVWEECAYGTTVSELVKTRAVNKGGRLRIYGRYPGRDGDLRFADETDFRYWDAEPTDEERQGTPWRSTDS